MKNINIIGERYGRLIVVAYSHKNSNGHYWVCNCECGTIGHVCTSGNLRSGAVKSCGCYMRDKSSQASLIHGCNKNSKEQSPEYRAWQHMKSRCYNKNVLSYKYHGARGISVCDRWLNSFVNFLEDMGPRPGSGFSLDRYPDNNGNYGPDNCRWASITQQNNNKRNNRFVEYQGKSLPILELAKSLNTTDTVIRRRIKAGRSIDDAKNRKTVIDLQTGIFYESGKDAARVKNVTYDVFLKKIKIYNNKLFMQYI